MKPEIVLAGIETLLNERSSQDDCYSELQRIMAELRHLEKEKDRVWKAFELTGDDVKFASEIRIIMSRIDALKRKEIEQQNKLQQSEHVETDIGAIQQYCEAVRNNLDNLTFIEKRNALEALRIRVIANQDKIRVEGTIPIVSGQCA